MDDTEKWTRFGVGIAHTVGTVALSAFGAGAVAPMVGGLENSALDSAFPRVVDATPEQKAAYINPGSDVRAAVAKPTMAVPSNEPIPTGGTGDNFGFTMPTSTTPPVVVSGGTFNPPPK